MSIEETKKKKVLQYRLSLLVQFDNCNNKHETVCNLYVYNLSFIDINAEQH